MNLTLAYLFRAAWLGTVLLVIVTMPAQAQDGPTMKRLAGTKTFTIGHRDASVPLSYIGSDGNVQGYSIDICLKIADAAKRRFPLLPKVVRHDGGLSWCSHIRRSGNRRLDCPPTRWT
jgi:ABC-type amino acid transport substrate-binding protein